MKMRPTERTIEPLTRERNTAMQQVPMFQPSRQPTEVKQLDSLQIAQPHAVQASKLFGLPAELRVRIYKYSLVAEDQIHISTDESETRRTVRTDLPKEPKLLQVCQQIRAEATPVYYGVNAFHAGTRQPFICWLSTIGEARRAMLKEVRGFHNYARDGDILSLVNSLVCIADVDRHFANAGVPLRKDVFHMATSDGFECVFMNQTQLVAKMTLEDRIEYRQRSRYAGLPDLLEDDGDAEK